MAANEVRNFSKHVGTNTDARTPQRFDQDIEIVRSEGPETLMLTNLISPCPAYDEQDREVGIEVDEFRR